MTNPIITLDLRWPAYATGVVGQLVVGERHSRSDVGAHRHASRWVIEREATPLGAAIPVRPSQERHVVFPTAGIEPARPRL
jgi:hypothetical protein